MLWTGDRLQNVQVFIGMDRTSYNLAAFKPGPAGSILTLPMTNVTIGQWLMVTRSLPHEQLTLCEVEVIGH